MVTSNCWRHFDFLCSLWGIHFLRSPGHFHLTNTFPSAEAHSIHCLSISLPMVHSVLEIFFFFLFSTKSVMFILGFFAGGRRRGQGSYVVGHTVERSDLFFNIFGLNSSSTVVCNGSVLNSVTKVFLSAYAFHLFFLNPRISTCIANVSRKPNLFQPKCGIAHKNHLSLRALGFRVVFF